MVRGDTQNYFLYNSHVKIYFHVHDNFTNNGTRQSMLDFRRDDILVSETTEVKASNHITKTSQSIKHNYNPYHICHYPITYGLRTPSVEPVRP